MNIYSVSFRSLDGRCRTNGATVVASSILEALMTAVAHLAPLGLVPMGVRYIGSMN